MLPGAPCAGSESGQYERIALRNVHIYGPHQSPGVLLGASSCYFAHGVCSCATQDADPKSQRRHRVCVQSCACTNAVLAIVWTAIFGLAMAGNPWWQYSWGAWLFFTLAALAAVLGSVGAQRRCDAGGPDAEEPPTVGAKEPV